jgi:hypothetical protein
MFSNYPQQHSITNIVTAMPSALVAAYTKKPFYTTAEVTTTFVSILKTKENIEYAYAMFCSLPHFVEQSTKLNIDKSYCNLRLAVAKECFADWTRFDFDSLLEYSQQALIVDVS